MIPDFLFSPPQSPFFFLLRVLVLSCSEFLFRPLRVPFSSSSKSRVRPLHPLPSSSILSHPPPQIPVPVLSDYSSCPPRFLFHPLKVLSPPLPPSQRKQRNDQKPSRRSWWLVVPKWNMILSLEDLPNNPLNKVEYSQHSTT